MAQHFLPAANAFRKEHVALFDFAFPAIAATWNLRWQVQGYLAVKPEASATELSHRFVFGSGYNFRNLRPVFTDQSWERQQDQFARFVLTNLIALYEGYLEQVGVLFGQPSGTMAMLQFPSSDVTSRAKPGISEGLKILTQDVSSRMDQTFAAALRSSRRYSFAHLDDMLVVYRYFKEVRNAFVHANGMPEEYMARAYEDLAMIGEMGLGHEFAKELEPIVPGQPVRVSFASVTTFSEVLLRIVSTIDAELAKTRRAEEHFILLWENRHGRRYLVEPLVRDPAKVVGKVGNLVVALGLPKPANVAPILSLLTSAGLYSDQ